MKVRRHHNNTGLRQIKTGKTYRDVLRIAKKLRIPYGTPKVENGKSQDSK